jgi:hypothetical protein
VMEKMQVQSLAELVSCRTRRRFRRSVRGPTDGVAVYRQRLSSIVRWDNRKCVKCAYQSNKVTLESRSSRPRLDRARVGSRSLPSEAPPRVG